MADGTRAHQLGADPVSMFLRIPAFFQTWQHNARAMELLEAKAIREETRAQETHEMMYGKKGLVPTTSPHAGEGGVLNVPGSQEPMTTGRIPGLYQREKEAGIGFQKTQTAGLLAQMEREQETYDFAKATRSVEQRPFSQKEYDEMMQNLDDDDATNDTMVAKAMEPLTRRLGNTIGRGTKYETYLGLKNILSAPGTKEKLIARLQRAGASQELIDMITDGSFLDRQMPVCAALDKIKIEERATVFATSREGKEFEQWGKERLARIKARTKEKKAPTMKKMQNPEGKMTWHRYDKDSDDWVDTGKIGEKPEKPGVERRRKIATAKDLAKAEDIISQDPNDPGIAGHISLFNEFSKKPYMYFQREEKPSTFLGRDVPFTGGTKLEKIELPVFNGKQVTAEDVMNTVREEEGRVSVGDVLIRIGVEEEVLRRLGVLE